MRTPSSFRTGLGYDTHRLVGGRTLWIGGLKIPATVGAAAHSDGDVLLHAACDALFGAIGAGDIGEHFPDSDPRWKDQASHHFLEEAAREVLAAGYRLVNLDATVFLESIRLSPYKGDIEARLGDILRGGGLAPECINVKAKTMEQCDAVGRGEAISAQVAVLLQLQRPE